MGEAQHTSEYIIKLKNLILILIFVKNKIKNKNRIIIIIEGNN